MRITRREFMKYCATAAGALGLTTTDLMKLEKALATSTADGGTQVVWLNGASCTGCTVSFANTAFYSSVQDLLVPWAKAAVHVGAPVGLTAAQTVAAIAGKLTDTGANGPLDLVFMETLSSSVGHRAIQAAKSALSNAYVLCIEGAIQTTSNGDYCRIGNGASASDATTISFANEVLEFANDDNCKVILAVGTCASFGGIPAAQGSQTGARGLVSTGKFKGGGYATVNTQGFWDKLKADYTGGFVKSISVTYGGSGYTATPTISMAGTATATAILTSGAISSIVVTNDGSGYLTAPTVTIANPEAGTIATATAVLGFDAGTGIDATTWQKLLAKTVCISGCPPHPDWIVGTIVYFLNTLSAPLMDKYHRPFDYYGQYQCDNCLWQKNNPSTAPVDILGGAANTWTKGGLTTTGNSPKLFKNKYNSGYEGCVGVLGCKGRKTKADCSFRRWNSDAAQGNGTSFCVQTRAGCHGCTDPRFPDGWGKFFSFK